MGGDSFFQTESLAYGIDFSARVTCKAFEEACADLKPKFVQPI
jgi:hypoxia up-regulated 1